MRIIVEFGDFGDFGEKGVSGDSGERGSRGAIITPPPPACGIVGVVAAGKEEEARPYSRGGSSDTALSAESGGAIRQQRSLEDRSRYFSWESLRRDGGEF